MKIYSAELAATAVRPDQYPRPSRPAIAMVGRSNVGKSSLINRLLQRKDLARTSSTPGKTATLNFYRINGSFDLVDLPGYGYAAVGRQQKARWAETIETFLDQHPDLRAALLLVDIRHGPSDQDVEMFEWLQAEGIPTTVVATKADKIGRSQWEVQRRLVLQTLNLEGAPPEVLVVASAETGEGKDRLWTLLQRHLSQERIRL